MLHRAADVAKLDVVLASQSPRRLELLARLGITHPRVVPSTFAEDLPKGAFAAPAEYCAATARAKLCEVWCRLRRDTATPLPDLVIGADSIVVSPTGEIFEKAESAAEAARMLTSLSGRTHQVITVLVLRMPSRRAAGGAAERAAEPDADADADSREIVEVSTTDVTFADVAPAEVAAYAAGHEAAWRGKAGAYGIQDVAAQYVAAIRGDFYTVMGLPVQRCAAALAAAFDRGWLPTSAAP